VWSKKADSDRVEINVADFSPGAYFLTVDDESGNSWRTKVMVQ
jgi:hypothetical protein